MNFFMIAPWSGKFPAAPPGFDEILANARRSNVDTPQSSCLWQKSGEGFKKMRFSDLKGRHESAPEGRYKIARGNAPGELFVISVRRALKGRDNRAGYDALSGLMAGRPACFQGRRPRLSYDAPSGLKSTSGYFFLRWMVPLKDVRLIAASPVPCVPE
ncbi:MAG: hypothetical protein ACRD68_03955, partial [Pyrinomonadaceae bacterium]